MSANDAAAARMEAGDLLMDSLIDEFDSVPEAVATAAALPLPPTSAVVSTNTPQAPRPVPARQQSPYTLAKRLEEQARVNELRVEKLESRRARHLAIAKECARRRTWPDNARAPPPEDPAVARQLAHLDFSGDWSPVFFAFDADKPSHYSSLIEADANDFFSNDAAPKEKGLLLDLLSVLLRAVPASCSLAYYIPAVLTADTGFAHEFSFVTASVGVIFQTMMGRLLDRASELKPGGGELPLETWRTLLEAARHEAKSYVALMVSMVLHRIPALQRVTFPGQDRVHARFVVWEGVEESVGHLLSTALPLFYRQFLRGSDVAIYSACLAAPPPPPAAAVAAADVDEAALDLMRRGLLSDQPCPLARLELVVRGLGALSAAQAAQVGGDELLPLVLQAVVALRPLHLASRVQLLHDLLPAELQTGAQGFALALLQSAAEALSGHASD